MLQPADWPHHQVPHHSFHSLHSHHLHSHHLLHPEHADWPHQVPQIVGSTSNIGSTVTTKQVLNVI